jgi:LacI family transcriptional regulator
MTTLAAVARAAGVSPATASKVLTGRADRIPAATAERIRQAAERLGYRGNALARAVRSGRSGCVGMLGNVLQQVERFDPFWSRVVLGAERALHARGLDLLLLGGDGIDGAIARAAAALAEHRVDGILLPALPGIAWRHPGPVVLVGQGSLPGVIGVRLDPEPGLVEAVRHVRAAGSVRLLVITSVRDGRDPQPERARILAAQGLPFRQILVERPWSEGVPDPATAIAATAAALVPVLGDVPDGTAIFASDDLLALACLRLLRPRVPHAVRIIGFDDIYADLGDPALSSIAHELMAMGREAAGCLADLLAGKPAADRLVPARFVPRSST